MEPADDGQRCSPEVFFYEAIIEIHLDHGIMAHLFEVNREWVEVRHSYHPLHDGRTKPEGILVLSSWRTAEIMATS